MPDGTLREITMQNRQSAGRTACFDIHNAQTACAKKGQMTENVKNALIIKAQYDGKRHIA